MDRCFTYLSGYADNGIARSSLLTFHPEGKLTPLPVMVKLKQHCLVVEAKIMRTWEKVRIFKY